MPLKELVIEPKNICNVQSAKINTNYFENKIFEVIDSYYFSKREKFFGIAVSGGPDSMLLLYIVNKWSNINKKKLKVFIFNHNLRPESIDEYKLVKEFSRKLGLAVLKIDWKDKPETAIMEKARIARYSEMAKLCKINKIKTLFLGHHADDVAETISMRLLKKSSINGLCPIFRLREIFDIKLFRPFLEIKKQEILKMNTVYNIRYSIDSSNYNRNYLRTRLREFLTNKEDLKTNLIRASKIFCKIRVLTNSYIKSNFNKFYEYKKEGYLLINRKLFDIYPEYMVLEFLNYSLIRIGNKKYPPNNKLLRSIYKKYLEHKNFTYALSGCIVETKSDYLIIFREYNNLVNKKSTVLLDNDIIWDNRFKIINKSRIKGTILPLGKINSNPEYVKMFNMYKKSIKKVPYRARITLPVIKTLEGCINIPHLNIYNKNIFKNEISILTIDFFNKKYDNIT